MIFKIPADLTVEITKLIFKFICKWNEPTITKIVLKEQMWVITLPDFKTYYKTIVLKIDWY